jgi:hypothetical protein
MRSLVLRDLVVLLAAVVAGLLLLSYLSKPAALLTDFLIDGWNLHTRIQYRIADTVPHVLAAIAVGTLLVLLTAPVAHQPHRLAIYLAILFPLVYLIGIAFFLTTHLFSWREAIVLTIRNHAVLALAFSAGCVLTSGILLRWHSKQQ